MDGSERQIIHPDWDMFTSDHVCATFHAVSRAICGGPIYVSDSVGCHDFDLLKKLIYADGTIHPHMPALCSSHQRLHIYSRALFLTRTLHSRFGTLTNMEG